MADVSMLQALQGYLQLTTERQQLITSNMANVDTPGYHTRDLNFQNAMEHVLQGSNETLSSSSLEIPDLPERLDGNNVNVDRESLLLSQTQLQYQLGVQLVKSEFHKLYTAIKEG